MPFDPADYPRSARWQAALMAEKPMGPNVLWLTEALSSVMHLVEGQVVLDLGCGRAFSSMFLARTFGVRVFAADLWIAPSANLGRVRAEGLEDRGLPLRVEAHDLPFAEAYFDAIVSLDAYHYFGTDDLYLGYVSKFVKPGGLIGIVVPGLTRELEDDVPGHLARYWEPAFWTFHTPGWWRRHWERSEAVEVVQADSVPDGAGLWLRSMEDARRAGFPADDEEAMVRADGGRYLGFSRVVARRL